MVLRLVDTMEHLLLHSIPDNMSVYIYKLHWKVLDASRLTTQVYRNLSLPRFERNDLQS